MRSQGTAQELEQRRKLAVRRVTEGWKQKDVAAFLGVTARAVSRWMAAYRKGGDEAIAAKPTPGRPPKLTKRQERGPTATHFNREIWEIRQRWVPSREG